MLAENLQHVREQRDAGAEQDQADDIETMHAALAKIGQVKIDQHQAGEANGKVDEKDDAPREVSDDEAAGDGPEHGADEAGDGNEGHGLD